MSEQDDQPLDPWIRAALLAEGLDGGPTEAQRSRMAGKLAAALGLSAAALLGSGGGGGGGGGDGGSGGHGGGGGGGAAGAGAAAGAAGTTIAGKTAALVIGAVIAGGGVGAAISELRPRSQPSTTARRETSTDATTRETPDATTPDGANDAANEPPLNDAAVENVASALTDAAPRARDAAASAPVDAAPRVRDAAVPRVDAATMTADELARERQLIDVARSALRGGDLQLAAKSLVEHGMRFPHGVLVEEQRVLSIDLAVAKGDLAGATTKANAFRRDYPRSVFRARVDELVPP